MLRALPAIFRVSQLLSTTTSKVISLLLDIRSNPDLHLGLEAFLGHVDDAAFLLLGKKQDTPRGLEGAYQLPVVFGHAFLKKLGKRIGIYPS